MPLSSRIGRPALGALSIASACLLFGANSLCVKLVSARIDPWRISFVRFIAGALLASAAIALTAVKEGKPLVEGFRVKTPGIMLVRALLGFAQMSLFFLGVAMTSSGRATLLNCTHPIFAALFGLLLFRERLPKAVFVGIALGFAGACIVFWDGSAYSLAGNLICIVAGASNGMGMHFVKRVRRDHGASLVYLAPCLFGIVATAFAAPGLAGIEPSDWGPLLLVGLLAFLGQFLMGWGLKYLAATAGSLLGLSEILFALSLSAVFLGETMPPRFFLGASLLLCGLVLTALVMGRRVSPPSSGTARIAEPGRPV
jgi:drug/metabolite transporter (DMT)-like permease